MTERQGASTPQALVGRHGCARATSKRGSSSVPGGRAGCRVAAFAIEHSAGGLAGLTRRLARPSDPG